MENYNPRQPWYYWFWLPPQADLQGFIGDLADLSFKLIRNDKCGYALKTYSWWSKYDHIGYMAEQYLEQSGIKRGDPRLAEFNIKAFKKVLLSGQILVFSHLDNMYSLREDENEVTQIVDKYSAFSSYDLFLTSPIRLQKRRPKKKREKILDSFIYQQHQELPLIENWPKRYFRPKFIARKQEKAVFKCITCGKPTKFGKPYCPKHVERGIDPSYLEEVRGKHGLPFLVSRKLKTIEEVLEAEYLRGCLLCQLPKDYSYRRPHNLKKLLEHLEIDHQIDPLEYFSPILPAKRIQRYSRTGYYDNICEIINKFILEHPIPSSKKPVPFYKKPIPSYKEPISKPTAEPVSSEEAHPRKLKTIEEVLKAEYRGGCLWCQLPKDYSYRRSYNLKKLLEHLQTDHQIDPIKYFSPILTSKMIQRRIQAGYNDEFCQMINKFILEHPIS